ncbi:MAG: glucose-6-phosphate isomerase [Synergistaceae bacterium]|jgi:glucose-6-phosphate isomerase|nr:glucose-6-phosphate isomerase [Synergistaceae bacterium]
MGNGIGISFSLGSASGSGRGSDEFEKCMGEFREPLEEAVSWIEKNSAAGESGFGWLNLPEADISPVLEAAEWLKGYDSIIDVGIGGSALGNLMLHQALLPMYYNELPRGKRGPRFYLADNPDPEKASAIWERVSGSRVALIGVSKSGATAETMSQFLWFRSRMSSSVGGDVDKDVLVITDPKGGVFRKFAEETGCRSLEIPPSVGGRYSALSPCGLVTASALGADVRGLIKGAASMKKFLSEKRGVRDNPALYLAAINRFHEKNGRPMSVLMPYSNRLETFAEWFAQLWGESVGKDGLGTTPVRALGAIDQHSQVQLYTAGPDDKLYTIINVANHGAEINLPTVTDVSLSSQSFLSGRGLGTMLGCEARSTASALVKSGRPVVWIELDRVDAHTIGALVLFYEYVTAVTGRLMKINPFDQPGVEQGKRYTYGLMGRSSYEADAREAEKYFADITRVNISA